MVFTVCNQGPLIGASLVFRIMIPPKYPFEPPLIYYEDGVYSSQNIIHPVINKGELVKLPAFTSDWNACMNLTSIVFTLELILTDPIGQSIIMNNNFKWKAYVPSDMHKKRCKKRTLDEITMSDDELKGMKEWGLKKLKVDFSQLGL